METNVSDPTTSGEVPVRVLRVDASMRTAGSVSREVADHLIEALTAKPGGASVTVRDLAAEPLPPVSEAWIGANFTDDGERTDDQRTILAQSDALIAELQAADVIVIGVPIYNFGVPAALKAWVDLVTRARVTFRYTADGPQGLLKDKQVFLAVASGGTAVDSPIDFATPYLRHILGFIGLTDVQVVAADRLMMEPANRDAAIAAVPGVVAASRSA